MKVLSSSWGGRAEHGILTVDAYIEENKLIITARDSYYNDYSPTGLPEKEEVYSEQITIEGENVDCSFMFEKIKELLNKNHVSDYRFDISDIKPIEGM